MKTEPTVDLVRPSAAYPSHLEADVVLRDGSTVHIRPARPTDDRGLNEFIGHLSSRSRWFRFFSEWANFDELIQKAVDNDYRSRLDLIATAGSPPKIVAHAMYVTTEPAHAEVAFAVSDAWHGRGLATIMLGHLAQAANANGISTFEAVTLPENRAMIDVFRASGFPAGIAFDAGEVHVEFPTSLGPEALRTFEEREKISAAAAVRGLLAPGSIAVVGASRREDSIGGAVLRNLVAGGYRGALYAVNPHATEVQSIRCYPSIAVLPERVEVAVIVVPADQVPAVAKECAEAGVRDLIVLSAGFAETGAAGATRQRELLQICRGAGNPEARHLLGFCPATIEW